MFGAANGMSTLARASSIAELFGPRHYGAISGAVALGANGARALGPVGAALLVQALGSYERVFWLLTGALLVVSLAVFATPAEVKVDERELDEVDAVTDRGPAARRRRPSRRVNSS